MSMVSSHYPLVIFVIALSKQGTFEFVFFTDLLTSFLDTLIHKLHFYYEWCVHILYQIKVFESNRSTTDAQTINDVNASILSKSIRSAA